MARSMCGCALVCFKVGCLLLEMFIRGFTVLHIALQWKLTITEDAFLLRNFAIGMIDKQQQQ